MKIDFGMLCDNMPLKIEPVGIAASGINLPNTLYFPFLVKGDVKKNQYVCVNAPSGRLIGMVVEIASSNRYYEKMEGVSDFSINSDLTSALPAKDWEYATAMAKVLGVLGEKGIYRSDFPVSPGSEVFVPEEAELERFLGFVKDGLEIGALANSQTAARIDMDRLFGKHLAILAMSGAGKSHLAAVLIEEMLLRPQELGRMGLVVFDLHGEYASFAHGDFAKQVRIVNGEEVKIPFASLRATLIHKWYPEMTSKGIMTLSENLAAVQKSEGGLKDLVRNIIAGNAKPNIKDALVPYLQSLDRMNIISGEGSPKMQDFSKPGVLNVFDMSKITSEKKRQMIVQFYTSRIFNFVKAKKLPPTLIMIEEAHNFAPEKARKGTAVAKASVEKIAREGRKFGCCLCLISQRPVHMSVTALSQCNSNIILRVTNPNDLGHIGTSCEGIDESMLKSITTLRTGDAILVGEAVNFPTFLKIRARKTHSPKSSGFLTGLALKFEEGKKKRATDVEAYL